MNVSGPSTVSFVFGPPTGPIPANSLIGGLRNFLSILQELGKRPEKEDQLIWTVTDMNIGSPAEVVFSQVLKPGTTELTADFEDPLVSFLFDGIEHLHQNSTIPRHFNENILKAIRSIGLTVAEEEDEKAEVRCIGSNGHSDSSIEITRVVAKHADEILSQSRWSYGSVRGRLESVTVHGRNSFRIYDSITGKGVPCYFKEDLFEKVRKSLARRVLAYGRKKQDLFGNIHSLSDITEIRPLETTIEMPNLDELPKWDLGGKSSEDYVRELWHGEEKYR